MNARADSDHVATRALFNSGRERRGKDWIANQLVVRLTRQERLTDDHHPLELNAVIHEFALRNAAGPAAVMRARTSPSMWNRLESVALIERVADELWSS